MLSEEEMIIKAKSGDKEAFQSLVMIYYPVVERFAYQIGNHPNEIEDITQEVFVKVYRFIETYSSAKFSTWLYKITLNISRDMIRKNKRHREKEKKLKQSITKKEHIDEDPLLIQEEYRFLHDMITSLNEKYKIPLVLFYFHDKKYDEIANILDLPLSTVKTRIARAKSRLKMEIEASPGGETHVE